MKNAILILSITVLFLACKPQFQEPDSVEQRIVLLHHSTGGGVWQGDKSLLGKISEKYDSPDVLEHLIAHNNSNAKSYWIEEMAFPKATPYGWNNYPYDYYTIWVKNAGEQEYMEEPTLEILTQKYNVIVFKHCFPVSWVVEDSGTPDINSDVKSAENYKLQYDTLKSKMHMFPNTKFIVWTGAALNKVSTNNEESTRAKGFFDWLKEDWDEANDNIYLWDFRELETGGGLFLKDEYAVKKGNSHPNDKFNGVAAKMFVNRLVDVIEENGQLTDLKGNLK